MKHITNFYTEKGNVASKTRDNIKAQAVTFLKATLPNLEDLEKGLAIPVCTNERNEIVYAFISVTVSANTAVKEKAPKAKATNDVVVPNLFE